MSDDFVFIPQEWGIPDDTFSVTEAGGKNLIVCYSDGDIFVMDPYCPVDGKHLGNGDFYHHRYEVECACGARFNYQTGKALKKR